MFFSILFFACFQSFIQVNIIHFFIKKKNSPQKKTKKIAPDLVRSHIKGEDIYENGYLSNLLSPYVSYDSGTAASRHYKKGGRGEERRLSVSHAIRGGEIVSICIRYLISVVISINFMYNYITILHLLRFFRFFYTYLATNLDFCR